MKLQKSKYYLWLFTLTAYCCFSQAPSIQWEKCYGGSKIDYGYSIDQTLDNGYIIAGYAESNNGNVSGLHNGLGYYSDFWVVRLDNTGNIKWQKCLGGSSDEYANCVRQTTDGGFIIAGRAYSGDGDVTGQHSTYTDCWVVKLDSLGNIKWAKCYGGTYGESANAIRQTSDGGYIFAGWTLSNNGDVSGNHGSAFGNGNAWVVKIDSVGILLWQKCFGGTQGDEARDIEQTADGGYVVMCGAGSSDVDVIGNHGIDDYWLIKLDASGNKQWTKCYGGSNGDYANSVRQTIDRGHILTGYSNSLDGDVTGNHDSFNSTTDFWIVKTDSLGTIKWQKSIGGLANDDDSYAQQTADGGYLVVGTGRSNDYDMLGNHSTGNFDIGVFKLDAFGNVVWQKCLGGSGDETLGNFKLTSDGGLAIVGTTSSNDGDVSGSHGGYDYWVVKLDNVNGIEEMIKENSFIVYPNPSNGNISITASQTINEIKITDVLGKIVYEHKPNVPKFAFQIESNGVYFMTLITGIEISTRKIVVQY